jgi:PAS domain S-box-containing protein
MPGAIDVRDARILVVDDLESDARLVEAMLTGSGFSSVQVTTDASRVVELYRANRYNLIILDLLMPGMDGFQVLESLAAFTPQRPLPVIVSTAEPDHMKRALEAGARDFVGKPVRLVELLPRVRNAIEAEGRYRALVEQSLAGIYIVEDGRWVYANPRLCEWLGYRFEEMRGKPSIDFVVEEDRARLLESRRRAFAGDRTALKGDFRMRRRDGSVVSMSFEARLLEESGRAVIFGVAQDTTDRERVQAELRRALQRLRTLSDRVLAIQEEERRHIARELHDDVGQMLVALDIGLHRLEPHASPAQEALLAECIKVAAGIREKIREISVELHPPHLDQLGLQDALRWLVSRQREMTGIEIECAFTGIAGTLLPPQVEAACYRICQEALSNAARHANPRRVGVELTVRHGLLVIRISDDGVGFDQEAQRAGLITSGSMGLVSMEERARLAGGRFEVKSAPGAGTCVSALFPLDAQAESAPAPQRVQGA